MFRDSINRVYSHGKTIPLILALCLVIPSIMPLMLDSALAEASDWGEDVGDVFLEHSWGHGSNVNITTDGNLTFKGGEFVLVKTTSTIELTDQDLEDGSRTNISLTTDHSLVLSVVAPSWSTRSAWNIPWVSASAWLASPTLGDIDDDGDLDAYVGLDNGTLAAYNNTGDRTFPTWTIQDSWNLTPVSDFAVPTFGDLDGDGDLDLLVGDNDGVSYGYNNTGNETWPEWTAQSAWDAPDVGQGAGPALVDIDDDGDLDVFIGNGPGRTRGYENTGDASWPVWTRNADWDPPNMGGIANPGFGNLDGDEDYDIIIGDSAGLMHTYENTGTVNDPVWTDKNAWDIPFDVGDYAAPSLCDIDNDGDQDAFVGENIATSYAFENLGTRADDGTFNSSAIAAGAMVNWTGIAWTENLPGNTDATLYVRTGNTTDPTDGTWSAWTQALSNPAGSSITAPTGSYIQVQVLLETTNTARTPEVSDIQLDYWYYNSTGALETNDLSPTDLVRWGIVTFDDDPQGETIGLNYSVDSGANWVTVPVDGNLSAVDITNGKIRFRANLSTSTPVVTPVFRGINLTYMRLLNAHHLHLDPTSIEVVVGEGHQFTAELHDINNNTLNRTLVWTTDIGAVDETGNLTAQTVPGQGNVTVTFGPLTATAQVTVLIGPLARLNITPSNIVLKVGETAQLTVKGFDKYDNEIPALTYNWTTDIGSLDPSTGNATTFTARTTPGSGIIRATVGAVNASIPVIVNIGPLDDMVISPSFILCNESDPFLVSAKGYDLYDNLIPNLEFNWSTGVGTVSPATGANTTFTSQEIDDNLTNQTVIGNVTAAHGAISSSITVTINGALVHMLKNLTIEPASVTLYPVDNATFNVTGYDQFGNQLDISANWSSDLGTMTPAVGPSSTLRPNVDSGKGVVTAKVGDISVSADVTVLPNETYPFPKILNRIPDMVKLEDSPPWSVDLNPYEGGGAADDDLIWHLEAVDTTLLKVSGEYDPVDTITFTVLPDATGNNKVRFILEDPKGYRAFQDVWVNVTPVNDPPVLEPLPDLMVRYETSFRFNYRPYVMDIDTSIEGLSLSVDKVEPTEADFKVQANGFVVTYDATKALLDKVFTVTISINDGTTTVWDTIKVTVTDNWVPELLKDLPDVTINEGERKTSVFDLDDYFTDKDKDMMFFTYGNKHVKISITVNHTVDMESVSEWSGQEIVTFRATDSKGALVEDDILVTVVPFDDPPTIGNVPDLMVRFDVDYTFDLAAYITDVDTPMDSLVLSFSDEHVWWAWDPLKMAAHPPKKGVSELALMMMFPYNNAGTVAPYSVELTITVSDGSNQDSDTVVIKVSDNFSPEVSRPLPDVEFEEDTVLTNAFTLSYYFLDLDGDALKYTVMTRTLTVNIKEDLNVNIYAPGDWYGQETITFRATDPKGGIIEDTIIATVIPVNDPPVLDAIPIQSMDEKTILSLSLADLIHDIDDDLNRLMITVLTADLGIRAFMSGSEVVIFGEEPGNYIIQVRVTDLAGTHAEGDIEVEVKEVKKPAPPPTQNNLLSGWFLLMIVLIIALVAAIGGYAGYRRYYGKYTIQEAFIIRKDGRMVAHISRHKRAKDKDKDIFSSMVAAVQMFIEDTFKERDEKETGTVQRMEYKGNTILVESGRFMYLVVLLRGTAGSKLNEDMKRFVTDTESEFGKKLVEWEGDLSDLRDISIELTKFIPDGYSETLPGLKEA